MIRHDGLAGRRSARRLPSLVLRHPTLALVALAVAIHAPFTGGGFLTDDFLHLERLERQTMGGVFTSADTFGFYRPLPQASLVLDLWVVGPNAALLRLANVVLHAAVVAVAHVLARTLVGNGPGAFLAVVAFVLTPKAHPVAVLWISARAELLMALFALTALTCWIRWHRGGGRPWLACAWVAYLLSLMCKETAVLLPLLMFLTPVTAGRAVNTRWVPLAGMLLTAGALLLARLQVNALMPMSADPHYDLATPLWRWFRNGRNYFWRALVSPIALIVMTAAAAFTHLRELAAPANRMPLLRLLFYGVMWYVTFILPVLPIAARSEHYLYLPVLGLCLPAGAAAGALFGRGREHDRRVVAALLVYVAGVGAFQLSRAAAIHADAVFSARFVTAIRQSAALADHAGTVVVVPADETTRRFLQDAIGGYVGTAAVRALGRHVPAEVGRLDGVHDADALVLTCSYVDGQVTLHPYEH